MEDGREGKGAELVGCLFGRMISLWVDSGGVGFGGVWRLFLLGKNDRDRWGKIGSPLECSVSWCHEEIALRSWTAVLTWG